MSDSSRQRHFGWSTSIAWAAFSFAALAQTTPARACDPVAAALGKVPVASCPGLDANGNGSVDLGELERSIGGSAANPNAPSPRGASTVTIDVGTTTGAPGAQATFEVTLDSGGLVVTGTQNDIAFDPLTPVATNLSGNPDCTVQPGINKNVFAAFQPSGCTPGVDCTGMRALVLSFSNTDPIPDGPLYSCNVGINPGAPSGTYPLVSSNEGAAGGPPDFGSQPTTGNDGAVIVSSIDDFKCYKAKDLKEPKFDSATVSLGDQFETQTAKVKKPFLICNPASVDGAPIANAADHLTCYKIKSPKLAVEPKVAMGNQLGTVHLQAKKAYLVCIRSTKQLLP